MFEIGNILTLADDNEYSVVDKFNDNGIIYVFLVDINNNSNIIYGKLENDEIVELSDADELEKIIKLVYEHTCLFFPRRNFISLFFLWNWRHQI